MDASHAEPALVDAFFASDLTVGDLWLRYFALGGDRTRQELQSYLGLESPWNETDHAILEQALTPTENEDRKVS